MKEKKPILILLLTVVAGCVTHVESTERIKPETQSQAAQAQPQLQTPPSEPKLPAPPPQPKPPTAADKRVVIAPLLAHDICVISITATTGSAGFLRIQVNVQSLVDSSRQFNYRIDWFDSNGMDLPMAASATTPWMLLSHESSLLAATAPTPAARDFRVTFLPAGE